jgi:hypothetical protein
MKKKYKRYSDYFSVLKSTLFPLVDFVGVENHFPDIFNGSVKVLSDFLYLQKQCIINPSAKRQ